MATSELRKLSDQQAASSPAKALVASAGASIGDIVLIEEYIARAERSGCQNASIAQETVSSRVGRAIDIVGSLVLIVALLPVLLLVSLLTAMTTAGTPIFGHARVGRNGKTFKCYKFRTMYVDADAMLQKLLAEDPERRRQWHCAQKLDDDPRVTPFGRFLRVTSLDELPQLINVLKGEMSLVGPRPIVQQELLRYGRYCASYLALRPGLTGLWQVTGRSGTTYRRRVATDHVYARRKCVTVDLRILLATIPAVLTRKGAC